MDAAEPFEARPRLAVAVSGGADSMALCLLAHTWATERGGQALALTVDHGLRAASGAEADRVGRWLSARGIEHEVLRWMGEKPRTGLEVKARQVRYRLLQQYCRERGVLHLLIGHHLQDQAETVVMRAARGSTTHGLAAMAAMVETGCARVIRPLLAVPPQRLRAYLMARAQPWIEDPTNSGAASTRGRIRAAMPAMVAEGWSPEAAAAAAGRHAAERAQNESGVAMLLAEHCRLHPAGFAILDAAALATAPSALTTMALARIATTIGGNAYPPSTAALERLRGRLEANKTGALGRCVWKWVRLGRCGGRGATGILVYRETRGLPAPLTLAAAGELIWDGRFRVCVGRGVSTALAGLSLCAMCEDDWRQAVRSDPDLGGARVPRQAALALPVLRDARGLLAIPALNWHRDNASEMELTAARAISIAFRPLRSLSGTGYFLA